MDNLHLLGDKDAYYLWDLEPIFSPAELGNFASFNRHFEIQDRRNLEALGPFICHFIFQDHFPFIDNFFVSLSDRLNSVFFRLTSSLLNPITHFVRSSQLRVNHFVWRNKVLRGLVFPHFLISSELLGSH